MLIAFLQSVPLETWLAIVGALVTLTAGGRYAWVARAAQALLTAAAAAHPGDQHAQLMHVGNAHKGERSAAKKRAAKTIRKRIAVLEAKP